MIMKNAIKLFLGMGLFSFSLTINWLCMRAIMAIGGFCAEGGAYQIAVHCPDAVEWLMPVSFITLFIGGGIYFASGSKNSPNWGVFFWTALFVALGWNFLDFAMHPGAGDDVVGWWICGVLFMIMGFAPLLIIQKDEWPKFLFGGNQVSLVPRLLSETPRTQELNRKFGMTKSTAKMSENLPVQEESRLLLLLIHVVSTAGGIYLAILIFNILN